MDFESSAFSNFAAVQVAMTQVGANTLITLANVLKTSLSAANFAFH